MRQRLLASLILLLIMLVGYYRLLTGQQELSGTMLSGEAMTMEYHITFGKPLTLLEQAKAHTIIVSTFEEVNDVCNQWNPNSIISACNQMHADVRQTIPPLLEELLLMADRVYRLSNKRYDLTIEPLKKLWMQALKQHKEPSESSLVQVLPYIGWHQVHIEKGMFWKSHDQLAINLDSIAKGRCVDLLTERLVAAGFLNLLVEWGGEVRAAGEHFQKRPWQLYIRRLEDADPANAIAKVHLTNAALATSGDYLQHWDVVQEGRRQKFFHIFDPHTLRPLAMHPGSIASVTVRAPTCALADALATAGMLCANLDEAKIWAYKVQKEYPDTAFWFVARKEI